MTDRDREFVRETVRATAWALIEADLALAKRIEAIEDILRTIRPGNSMDDTIRAIADAGLLAPGSVIEVSPPPPGAKRARWSSIRKSKT